MINDSESRYDKNIKFSIIIGTENLLKIPIHFIIYSHLLLEYTSILYNESWYLAKMFILNQYIILKRLSIQYIYAICKYNK